MNITGEGAHRAAPLFLKMNEISRIIKLLYLSLLMGIPFVTGSVYVQPFMTAPALLLLAAGLIIRFVKRDPAPPLAGVILFLFWCAALLSPQKALSLETLSALMLSMGALFLFEKRDEKILTPFLVGYSFLMGLYVGFQFLFIYPKLLNEVSDPAQLAILSGERFFGTFALPNIYSFFLLAVIILSLQKAANRGGRIYLVSVAFNIVMLLLTRSFIATLILFGTAVLFAFQRGKKPGWILTGAALPAGALFILLRGWESLGHSLFFRLSNYISALKIFRDYPLTGVGLNHYDLFYPLYRVPGANYVHNAHSLPLQLMADLGGAGILIFFLLTALLWKTRKTSLFPLLAALMLHFSLDLTFYIPSVAVLFWAWAGIALDESGETREREPLLKRIRQPLLLGLVLATVAVSLIHPPLHPFERISRELREDVGQKKLYSHFIQMSRLNRWADPEENPEVRSQYDAYKEIWQK